MCGHDGIISRFPGLAILVLAGSLAEDPAFQIDQKMIGSSHGSLRETPTGRNPLPWIGEMQLPLNENSITAFHTSLKYNPLLLPNPVLRR